MKTYLAEGFVNLNNEDDKLFRGEGKKDEKYWRLHGVSEVLSRLDRRSKIKPNMKDVKIERGKRKSRNWVL